MIGARLPLASAAGFAPDGPVAVFHPAADADLSAVEAQVISPLVPVHAAFSNAIVAPEGRYAASVVCVPRAKAEARALIAKAMAITDGPVLIDGQKTDGIDSLLKEVRKRAAPSAPVAKAHGKAFWLPASDAFDDWAAGPALTEGGFWTAPGVFSADGIDDGSALLAAALPDDLGSDVADLGAGWGMLSAHVLVRPSVQTCHLVEAHHLALECAKRNVTDPRARYHWADVTTWTPPQAFGDIVMNPPFHTGRAPDPSLGQAFIGAAARALSPRGRLWMVANRHLPYEEALNAAFGQVQEIGGDARFKLTLAARPRRR
ncbi:MAG: class I SAM-dependent methyltransferase [Pseudomonadota bacterium]